MNPTTETSPSVPTTQGERTREITVVLHITEERTGTYEIDVADYRDWRQGEPDTPEMLREYLRSGDDFEVIQSVYDDSERRQQVEIWSSDIEEVRP